MLNVVKFLVPHRRSLHSLAIVRKRDRRFEGEAIVDCEIHPEGRGRVYFRGSWWFAKCDRGGVLLPGERVRVVGVEEITLLVQPLKEVR